jgi:hypothetical protein
MFLFFLLMAILAISTLSLLASVAVGRRDQPKLTLFDVTLRSRFTLASIPLPHSGSNHATPQKVPSFMGMIVLTSKTVMLRRIVGRRFLGTSIEQLNELPFDVTGKDGQCNIAISP